MSLSNLLYVKETPWKGLGTQYETQPSSAREIVDKAKIDWKVGSLPMVTSMHDHVDKYHAIYREDLGTILGVVNKNPNIVQNENMFNAFDYLIGKEVDVESVSSFDEGKLVMGAFKIRQSYKLLDDDIDHYFVVINDHLKADGKISVLNTPVRIICQNCIETAIQKSFYHLRVPVGTEDSVNRSIASTIIGSVTDAFANLQEKAEDMYKKKVDRNYIDRLLDELFPYTKVEDDSVLHSKANEKVELIRDTFITQCLDADNLANYRGSQYQVYMALTDFHQHYVSNIDKAYDIGYRMKKLQGVGVPTSENKVVKFLKIADKLAA